MQLGKFYSSEGKYEFNGRWYKPRWFANLAKIRIDEAKPILEAGHAGGVAKRPQAICLITQALWEKIKTAGFGSWSGLTMWHYYDNTTNAGVIPNWMIEPNGYGGALIHEYADGKVCFLKEWTENNIYTYFLDTTPVTISEPINSGNTGTNPTVSTLSIPTKWSVKGKLWFMDIDITVETE